jgi:hypothetical protein
MSENTVKNTVKNLGFSRGLTDFEGVVKPKKPFLTGL